MRIACIGDLHLISRHDPHQGLRENRSFFMAGQDSLLRLFKTLEQHPIDLVVFLGDLVDWVSDENITYALETLEALKLPWKVIPGNHDFGLAHPEADRHSFRVIQDRAYRTLWQRHGLDMKNEFIDGQEFGLVLLDNALSNLTDDSLHWLDKVLDRKKHNIICQHVPLDLPEIRSYIHDHAPNRNLSKYTCSAHPHVFQNLYARRVQAVVSGHVHLSGTVSTDSCTHHLCNMGVTYDDPHRNERAKASATLLTFDQHGFQTQHIQVD